MLWGDPCFDGELAHTDGVAATAPSTSDRTLRECKFELRVLDLALVLSGGGPLGVGWELGVLRGLRDGGADLGRFERVIGTSAGAIAATLLTTGASLEPVRTRPGPASPTLPRPAMTNPDAMREVFAIVAEGGTGDQARRAQVGAMALENTTPENVYLDIRRQVVPDVPWPRGLVITAVDVVDGAFVSWGDNDGVPLVHAVAASTALPGAWPPVTIGGRRFMDGGLRSLMAADLASGSRFVLIVAALPGTHWPARLAAEVAAIEAAGGEIVEIRPDAASEAAFGPDRTDESRQTLVFEAGFKQGSALAGDVSGRMESRVSNG